MRTKSDQVRALAKKTKLLFSHPEHHFIDSADAVAAKLCARLMIRGEAAERIRTLAMKVAIAAHLATKHGTINTRTPPDFGGRQ